MMKLNQKYIKIYAPHWLVFFLDLIICFFSISLSYIILENFYFPDNNALKSFVVGITPFALIIRGLTFYYFRSYAGLIRYTSAKDTERIFVVVAAGSATIALLNLAKFYFFDHTFLIPFSVLIVDFFISVFMLSALRLFIKTVYHEIINPNKTKNNVIIYGADEFGVATYRTLERDENTKFKVIAFLDNQKNKVGKKLEGINIHTPSDLEKLVNKYKVGSLIISQGSINPKCHGEIIEKCLDLNIQVLRIPEVNKWINGELSLKQIKNIKIEELLARTPIELENQNVQKDIINKVVLITGAAGSIGSEIVRQVCRYFPTKVILIDQAESPLYDIELEIKEEFHFYNIEVEIGSISNFYRISQIFEKHKPDIIYHAAAYKHVPMMENNPSEAIFTNVWGTKTIADLSIEHGVKKFVMISTDKAVNPTNVMGASKRIAEIYIQSLNKLRKTTFVTTRFGNVLGSNGSVIPRFKKQIEAGGPVTITHPEITRFFMTIPEACQLVLEAGAMGKNGEIFLFDMGESVKILDLAKKMIKLYGLKLGRDIHIAYTGLRPGEKLYEELLFDKENTISTHHPKIMIAKNGKNIPIETLNNIDELIDLIGNQDRFSIVRKMKEIVPEFKSKNSIYENLDKINGYKPKVNGHKLEVATEFIKLS